MLGLASVKRIPHPVCEAPSLVILNSAVISYRTLLPVIISFQYRTQKTLVLQTPPFPILWEDWTIVQECLHMVKSFEECNRWPVSHQEPLDATPCLSWGYSGQSIALTTHPYLAPRLKKYRTIPVLPSRGKLEMQWLMNVMQSVKKP
jgi:hypothetical protein